MEQPSEGAKQKAAASEVSEASEVKEVKHEVTLKTKLRSIQMPILGFGTYLMSGDECANAVSAALRLGYRRIDTAAIYRNESQVGKAIRESGIPRGDIFVTSKLAPKDMKDEKSAYQACIKSLEAIGFSYFDLYIIHWPGCGGLKSDSPQHAQHRRNTWRALEKLYNEGKCRAIGVSNYLVSHLKELLSYAVIAPAVNQIEIHPFYYKASKEVIAFCEQSHIFVEAYSSLGEGSAPLLQHNSVRTIAAAASQRCQKDKKSQARNVTPAQVLLRWGFQHNFLLIPKSKHEKRIEENANIFDFELSPSEMQQLDTLETQKKYCWDPSVVA